MNPGERRERARRAIERRRGRTPADRPAPSSNEGDDPICDVCGARMFERHCKILCPVCGYQRDCSDP